MPAGIIMRIALTLVVSLFACSLALTACGGKDDAESFDTLQECFDDHHTGAESLPTAEAITVCCIDHPIAGVHPSCKDTAADCVAYVDASLDSTVTTSDIQTACTDYINQK
jgi:hypothetical protein